MGRIIVVVLIFVWLAIVLSCWFWLCIKENRLQRRQNALNEGRELSYHERLRQLSDVARQVKHDRTSSDSVENSTAQSSSSPPAYRPPTMPKGIRIRPHPRGRQSRVY